MGAVCGCIRATATSLSPEARLEENKPQGVHSTLCLRITTVHPPRNKREREKRIQLGLSEFPAFARSVEYTEFAEFAETEDRGIAPISEDGAIIHDSWASSYDNKRVQEARRARVEWLQKLRRECASQQEFDTMRSHSVWTQVDSSSCAPQRPSPAALEHIRQENRLYFQHLLDTQPSPRLYANKTFPLSNKLRESELSKFFADFGDSLEAGRKIGGGAQADIHEAVYNGEVLEWCVLKVFGSEHLLEDLQHSWTKDMIHFDYGWTIFTKRYRNCCSVKHGTLLQDGRFAFVLQRCWGDLRKAIDVEIVQDKTNSRPPFPHLMTGRILVSIAHGMAVLHQNGILHKDLKAANCLLLHNPKDTLPPLNRCMIADFESCEGVEGTRFWRAPEVLCALRNRQRGIYSIEKIWTKAADVYSYAMTCYEVITGCTPFEDCAANDYDGVIRGEEPPLPNYIEPKLQKLLRRCWHNDPYMRPPFVEVLKMLNDIYPKASMGFPIDEDKNFDGK